MPNDTPATTPEELNDRPRRTVASVAIWRFADVAVKMFGRPACDGLHPDADPKPGATGWVAMEAECSANVNLCDDCANKWIERGEEILAALRAARDLINAIEACYAPEQYPAQLASEAEKAMEPIYRRFLIARFKEGDRQ